MRDLRVGMDRSDQAAVNRLDLVLDVAHHVLMLVQFGIQTGNHVGMASALDCRMMLLVSSVVLLVSGYRDLVTLVMNMSL